THVHGSRGAQAHGGRRYFGGTRSPRRPLNLGRGFLLHPRPQLLPPPPHAPPAPAPPPSPSGPPAPSRCPDTTAGPGSTAPARAGTADPDPATAPKQSVHPPPATPLALPPSAQATPRAP